MKWNFKPIDVEEWIVEKTDPPKIGTVNEHLKLDPFPYPNSGDSELYKLVLHWEYTIKTPDLKRRYCFLRTEQEFTVKFDDKDDNLAMMPNIIGTALLHLEQQFDSLKGEAGLANFKMSGTDNRKSAHSILTDLGR